MAMPNGRTGIGKGAERGHGLRGRGLRWGTKGRAREELALLTALGPALMTIKGYASNDVVTAYSRAHELCQKIGDAEEIFPVLWGLWLFHLARGDHATSRKHAEQCLGLAQEREDPTLLMQAHLAFGASQFFMAEFENALRHLDECISHYDPDEHGDLAFRYGVLDSRVVALAYSALTLWPLGRVDQAIGRSDDALAKGAVAPHPYSGIRILNWDSQLRQLVGDHHAVLERADTAMA